MYCNQCEETKGGQGCTTGGVCGKSAQVAELQDLLIYTLAGISYVAKDIREKGEDMEKESRFVTSMLFSTITNVNFDPQYFQDRIAESLALRDDLKSRSGKSYSEDWVNWNGDYAAKAKEVGIMSMGSEDETSLRSLVLYGLKGMAAYYEHASILGYRDESIEAFMQGALVAIRQPMSVEDLLALVLKTGTVGVTTMALLDQANTETYGKPEITRVNIGVRDRPGILISGHDLKDLAELLEQSKDSGVDVYTHGEMLPTNAYPAFKGYEHFVGNYGNAWWKQRDEFESFNGPVVLTTNCLVPPKDSYKDRVYTTSVVGFPGLKSIADRPEGGQKDFSMVIEHAKRCAPPKSIEEGEIVIGFARDTVLSVADKVVEAVKSGAIKRFVVMAGCDGRNKDRSYYTDFASALPKDTVILTAGCAKYRYNKLHLGDIGGIPRVLDAGQCNDCYSLVVIATKLAEAFGVGVNELPLSFNISWYEQKAALVLLALLSLGVKDIMLGPRLPAFVSPNVLNVLVENFNIMPNSNVADDMVTLSIE
ncbi:MAG: hydroxylamine reductase [Candidatus Methanomethylophilaceae archaeon]